MAESILSSQPDRAGQRAFLNRTYDVSRFVYDATRKYYLLGRDPILDQLLTEPWDSLIEVGVGTGRNLRRLHSGRPTAAYAGIEPCDEMRRHAQPRVPWARLVDTFAEEANFESLLGRRPDRILFSYCLSMIPDARGALERAIEALGPNGAVVVVDFGSFSGLPLVAGEMLRGFLAAFHVCPKDVSALGPVAHEWREGGRGYFVTARFRRGD